MSHSVLIIIYLLIWFLVPALPAFLFFKILPNKAIVKGPFKGLRIDLGGAFAGYFLLIITAVPFMNRLIIVKSEDYEVWTVTGNVNDERTGRPIPRSKNPRILVYPPIEITAGTYTFSVIATRKGERHMKFPILIVQADGYPDATLEDLSYKIGTKPAKQSCKMECDDKLVTYDNFKLQDTVQTITYAKEDN